MSAAVSPSARASLARTAASGGSPSSIGAAGGNLSPETLRSLLRYDVDSGKLFWRARSPEMFCSKKHAAQWNTRFAGKAAFAPLNAHGYATGKILGVAYYAHRVAWAMETGAWPEDQIDHINGARNDNRFANLRHVTNAENAKNRRLLERNTSGHVGVSWDKASGKWVAKVKVDGKVHYLGWFNDIELAAAARKSADKALGFHGNHGSVMALTTDTAKAWRAEQ